MDDNPIVRRLLKSNKSKVMFEADEDEENLDTEDTEDDSQYPGVSPDESEDEGDFEEEKEEQGVDEYDPYNTSEPSGGSSSPLPPPVGEESEDEPSEEPVVREPVEEENPNPLDNTYAVEFSIGDEVAVSRANGSKSDLHCTIEGYDKEGFYRVKWPDGSVTNGLTDMALAGIATRVKENVCVCGSKNFVTEGANVVCDICGRKIYENMDHLTVLDKSRPKGKRMIRSQAHPVSTSNKPNISLGETIKKSLRGKINEGTSKKRIAAYKEFDNGRVLYSWEIMKDEEAEDLARRESLKDPDNVYYVAYDNVMHPTSDLRWVAGKQYHYSQVSMRGNKPYIEE